MNIQKYCTFNQNLTPSTCVWPVLANSKYSETFTGWMFPDDLLLTIRCTYFRQEKVEHYFCKGLYFYLI